MGDQGVFVTEPAGRPVRRRDVLTWGGGAVLVSMLAACTRKATPQPTATPTTAPPTSPASTTPVQTSTAPTSTVPVTPSSSAAGPTLDALSSQLAIPLVRPGSSAYTDAARLYNPRFDSVSRPEAIARCTSAADVAACVRFAAESQTSLRLRSGGHSYGGWSTGSGLIADVSRLSAVTVDTAAQTARIGAGAKLAGVYSALAAKGVALAAGSCPTVGMAGLALGGGVGVLSRAFGLTCDAVRSVEIVTADGQLKTVSSTSDPDLFWALRGGGGGSFGAVTAFTVAVRAAPTVTTFYLAWDVAHAQAVLSAWQGWIASADRRLWSTCKVLVDPGPGTQQVTVSGTWVGPSSGLAAQLSPLRAAIGATPSSNVLSTLGYAAAMLAEAGCSGQSASSCVASALTPAKRQPFAATSAILASPLPAAGIAAAVSGATAGMSVPGLFEGGVSFDSLGGAVSDVGVADTPFPYRKALASVQFTATWTSGSTPAAPFDAYVRAQRAGLSRWTGTAAYVNYADASITDYGTAYWGSNYARLQQVKKTYDPGGLFTFPQAVKA